MHIVTDKKRRMKLGKEKSLGKDFWILKLLLKAYLHENSEMPSANYAQIYNKCCYVQA